MAEVIKKAKVSKNNLPAINSSSETYGVRYRVISEDKNRSSSWSPIFDIDPNYTYVPGKINITSSSGAVSVTWDPVSIKIGTNVIKDETDYDVWIKWSQANALGDFIYVRRVTGNSTSFVVPDTYYINTVDQSYVPTRITVEVYLKGDPITRNVAYLRVYNPAIHTI
jgi:hypothetical protein